MVSRLSTSWRVAPVRRLRRCVRRTTMASTQLFVRPAAFALRRASLSHTQQLAAAPRRHCSNGDRSRMIVEARKGLAELLSLRKGGGDGKASSGKPAAPLKPGKVAPMLEVPAHIPRPPYAASGRMPDWDDRPQIHDAAGIQKMRAAGKLAADVLEMAGRMAAPGVTTDAIDRAVHKMIIEAGAYPSPLNYGRFPKSVCTSVNEVICHGIPDSRPLQEGDIVNIDVTVFLDGHHGDTSRMFYVGQVSPEARRLCEATKEALNAAIAVCGPGVPVKSIGAAIQDVADKHKFGVVKAFVGHGVGTAFHSYPHVSHFRNNEPGLLQKGMTFTIEPMLSCGSTRERYWADGWTAVTTDGSLSAQWEHTLLVTDGGVDILTQYE